MRTYGLFVHQTSDSYFMIISDLPVVDIVPPRIIFGGGVACNMETQTVNQETHRITEISPRDRDFIDPVVLALVPPQGSHVVIMGRLLDGRYITREPNGQLTLYAQDGTIIS